MSELKFYKLQASGNDFILLDQRLKAKDRKLKLEYKGFAKRYCNRKFGIGADGVLVIEPSSKADFLMRIFNADGSEAEMCGNGARCVALYNARGRGQGVSLPAGKAGAKKIKFETIAGIINAEINGDNVKLKMTDPTDLRLDFPLEACGRKIRANFINTGVPHAVVFVEGLGNIDIESIGRDIRNHKFFAPKGANVNFVEIAGNDKIALRTYERGVEAETLACGTGTVASCIIADCILHIAHYKQKQHRVIQAKTKSEEILKVHFDINGKRVENVWLEGRAQMVFKGELY